MLPSGPVYSRYALTLADYLREAAIGEFNIVQNAAFAFEMETLSGAIDGDVFVPQGGERATKNTRERKAPSGSRRM